MGGPKLNAFNNFFNTPSECSSVPSFNPNTYNESSFHTLLRGLAWNLCKSGCFHLLTKKAEWLLYLRKQVETAQLADNTVHLRKPLPLPTGLEYKHSVICHKQETKYIKKIQQKFTVNIQIQTNLIKKMRCFEKWPNCLPVRQKRREMNKFFMCSVIDSEVVWFVIHMSSEMLSKQMVGCHHTHKHTSPRVHDSGTNV